MKQDVSVAEQLYDLLLTSGAEPWLDRKCLALGDNWKHEIREALRRSDLCVVCLRPGFDERGFRQREIKWATEEAMERPPGKGFIIPFIVEPCDLPSWCREIHAGADLSKPTAYEDLLTAINKHCSTRLSVRRKRGSDIFRKAQINGARSILVNSLELKPSDSLLIISDETSMSAASCILNVATQEVGASVSVRLATSKEQQISGESIPIDLIEFLEGASVVILLGAATTWGTQFRLAVLRYATADGKKRIATLPGVTSESLEFAAVDWSVVTRRVERVGEIIASAARGTLETEDSSGSLFSLDFALGDYRPVLSSGRVSSGNWVNLPAGEVYVLPDRDNCRGEVAINGSLPGYVVPEGHSTVLTVEHGRLTNLRGDPEVTNTLRRLIYENGKERVMNAAKIAEIGVGLNHCIRDISGAPFLDQKKLGFVHIGMGANHQLGGLVFSRQHMDLVTRQARLSFDSELIIIDGEYVCGD